MHRLLPLVVLAAAVLLAAPAASAADEAVTLEQPKPSWLTPALERRVVAAGPRGLEVKLDGQAALEANCLGTAPPYAGTDGVSATAVSAGTCMVAPHACTMNFVFRSGSTKYIGTA